MKKIRKIIAISLLVILIICTGTWYYVFIWSANHHRKAEDEKGIVVNAAALVDAFEKNEQNGNALYLDKAVEVTGTIEYVKLNQAGKQTVRLQSNDPMAGVMCTLRNKDDNIQAGTVLTLKGICTGYLSDVIIIDAVVIKNSVKPGN